MGHQSVSLTDFYGRSFSAMIDEKLPDRCPLCHTTVLPKKHQHFYVQWENLSGRIEVVFQCTKYECQSLFIGIYTLQALPTSSYYQLERVTPIKPDYVSFSDEIRSVSPPFIEIYNQALSAESSELHQLTGIGLRKALEFLVKDFASIQHPDEVPKIQETLLGKCIDRYLDDPRIKDCAKRAAWLGNDETHYTRKWEDKDIRDLKMLIRLTINWIENVLLTEKYIDDMPE